ncbi:MAG: hypothetical protein WB698_06055 [Solirubrobacteraceae bacterium]
MSVAAVFPTASMQAGMYESFYLRAVSPVQPVGVWIRCTVHKRPGQAPRGSVWCTVFDAASGAPFMNKVTTEELSVPAGGWIAVGQTRLGPGVAEGVCGEASWSLRFESDEQELRHLPHGLLYHAPLPRTKLTSPAPAAGFSGSLQLGQRTIDLDGWHGMIGHNWGSEHAARWIWLHGIDFDQTPGAWIDLAVGRIEVAGRLTPWVANGALCVQGQRLRLGGLLARGLRVAERPERCSLHVPGPKGLSVEAHVQTPSGTAAGWRYADPDGGKRDVVNCSIAALRLVLRRKGEASQTLISRHGAAYELGMRAHDHEVSIAPFGDD